MQIIDIHGMKVDIPDCEECMRNRDKWVDVINKVNFEDTDLCELLQDAYEEGSEDTLEKCIELIESEYSTYDDTVFGIVQLLRGMEQKNE